MRDSVPDTMAAAVCVAPRRIAVERRPVPVLDAHDVLIAVGHCGVCGTDVHLIMDGWGQPNTIGGHEYAGEIVAVGPNVTAWRPGDLVVARPQVGCGACPFCRGGRPSLCLQRERPGVTEYQGAFAEYVRAPADHLLRIPPGLSPRVAALCEPLAVALHAITRADVQPGHRVLISGGGPIGALAAAALKAGGVEDVTVSEPGAARRTLALRLGAQVMTPDQFQTPPLPFDQVEHPFDVVLECSGHAGAIEATLGQLARAGTLVVVGTGLQRPQFDSLRVLVNELVVTGAFNYDEHGFDDALALLASSRLPTDLLLESTDVSLAGMQAALEAIVAGTVAGKVLVAPHAGEPDA